MGPNSPASFAQLLKRFRTLAGLTQEELAERAGLSVRGISDLEREARVRPQRATLERLADALQLTTRNRALFFDRHGSMSVPRSDAPAGYLGSFPDRPLIGRSAELAQVLLASESVVTHASRVVMLSGEPGVGKTRLAQELSFVLEDRQFLVLTGRCHETEEEDPFYPFVEALAQAHRAAPEHIRVQVATQWQRLGLLFPEWNMPRPDPSAYYEQEQQLLFRAVRDFLTALCLDHPVALLLDDLQWADESSIRLVQYLARHARNAPILIVGTFREHDVPAHHKLRTALLALQAENLEEQITLARLDGVATAELIESIIGSADIALSRTIYELTDGNPFFTLETIRTLLDNDQLQLRDGRWSISEPVDFMIPTNVRAAIAQRVAKLPEGTRTILQFASVLGAWFSFDDLKEMSGWNDDALEAALENAADSGLVHAVERDQYSFNHVMIGKALYAEIQDHRRRRLHLAAAELMERTGARHAVNLSAEVAHHLLEGGALKRALPWFIRAGENAETVYAHPEAEQLLRTAVKLARDLNDRTLLTEAEAKLEEILATVACNDEAVTRLETAVDTSLVEPRILIISGLPGAGKSTTARLLASQMCRGAHVEADKLQELIVAGGIWPDGSPNPTAEAQRQLRLRLHHACLLARSFANHGFSAIIDDIVIGERLEQAIEEIAGTPFGFVMLLPDFELVRERWKALGSPFVDKWQWIDDEIRTGTRRVGLWLDTTSFTPEQTVQEIIRRFDETVVSLP